MAHRQVVERDLLVGLQLGELVAVWVRNYSSLLVEALQVGDVWDGRHD